MEWLGFAVFVAVWLGSVGVLDRLAVRRRLRLLDERREANKRARARPWADAVDRGVVFPPTAMWPQFPNEITPVHNDDVMVVLPGSEWNQFGHADPAMFFRLMEGE